MSSANTPNPQPDRESLNLGLVSAIAAFGTWGLLPLYWKMLEHLPATTILLHRILWSFILLVIMLLFQKRLKQTVALLKNKRTTLLVLVSSLLLTSNWLIFIWAVNSHFIIETSLGYFLTPIINMLFGVAFFKERPAALQWLAIALASCGVLAQIIFFGRLPWIALSLALTFGAYGALRKTVSFASIPGLFMETFIIMPLVTVCLVFCWMNGDRSFSASTAQTLLLMGSGLATTLPLIWFGYSAKRLRLTTLGLTQYLSPSCSLMIGFFIFKENLTVLHLISFGCIWAALIIYSAESLRLYRRATALGWKKPD